MMQIRAELPADIDAVRAVHRAAFDSPLEARLVDALRQAGKAVISRVLCEQGEVRGHVVFSPVTVASCPKTKNGVGLAPVGILPAHQNKGLGTALIKAGLEAARVAGYDFVVVLGDPDYYPRFGFSAASAAGLSNEYQLDEPFMALALKPEGLKGVRGLVKYAKEFEIFES